MGYSFKDLAKDVLEKTGKAMTVSDIWSKGEQLGLSNRVSTNGKTPLKTLASDMNSDIRKLGQESVFKKVSKGVFALNNDTKITMPDLFLGSIKSSSKYSEKDLHKLLVTFVNSAENFQCWCKTIDEKKSEKKAKGTYEWLHPDIVGVQYFFENQTNKKQKDKNDNGWENVIDLMKEHGDSTFKLFSFELKKDLDMPTLRQKYFQAVSNSSWANEGYLVVLNILDEPIFLDELKRLNNAFGIGVIKLDPQSISRSEIIYPAQCKEIIDWNTVTALNGANEDFKTFIKNVRDSVNTQRVVDKEDFDKPFECEEEAEKYAREKGMIK